MRKAAIGAGAAWFIVAIAGIVPAAAQDSVGDRLDRIERDLNQLQRQVYRNEVGTDSEAAPSGSDTVPTPSAGSGTQALNVQMRLDTIDNQLRQLNGQIEESQYGIAQLKGRLDKMQQDDEQRFQALEHPGAGSAGAQPGAAAGPGDNGAGNPNQAPSTSGYLVAPPGSQEAPVGPSGDSDQGTQQAAPAPGAESGKGAATGLPAGSPKDQYAYAFGLLRQRDTAGAESAFKSFLQQHPKDSLAGSAEYWLGSIYYERKQYDKAIPLLAESYEKFPKGPKGPDALLKLGQSLAASGHRKEACAAFSRLDREAPQMSPAVKSRERAEKQRLSC